MPIRLSSLRRITSSQGWIPEVDGLRFVAILMVVVAHLLHGDLVDHPGQAPGWLTTISRSAIGASGVRLFFVLSGFILSGPFLRALRKRGEGPKLKSFYLRRLTRLEPTYFIAMTAWLAVKLFYKHWPLDSTLGHYLSTLTYTHYFVFNRPSILLPATWSLEIEIQFYLLMPFLARLVFSRPARHRAIIYSLLISIPILLNLLAPPGNGVLAYTILGHLHFFATGMAFADLHAGGRFEQLPDRVLPWLNILPIASLLSLLILIRLPLVQLTEYVLISAMIGSALAPTWARKVMQIPVVATIGGMCYSIYLFHNLIMEVIVERGLSHLLVSAGTLGILLRVATGCLVIFVICIGLFALLERPFMNPRWPADFRAWLLALVRPRTSPDAR